MMERHRLNFDAYSYCKKGVDFYKADEVDKEIERLKKVLKEAENKIQYEGRECEIALLKIHNFSWREDDIKEAWQFAIKIVHETLEKINEYRAFPAKVMKTLKKNGVNKNQETSLCLACKHLMEYENRFEIMDEKGDSLEPLEYCYEKKYLCVKSGVNPHINKYGYESIVVSCTHYYEK